MKNPTVLGFCFSLLLASSGCMQSMAPDRPLERASNRDASSWAQTSTLFYPLDIGNHWSYEQSSVLVLVPRAERRGLPPNSTPRSTWT
jgi:hypothetical protein